MPIPTTEVVGARGLLWFGAGSIFTSLLLFGLVAIRQPPRVQLATASGADRLAGVKARWGEAAERILTRHDRGRRLDARLDAAAVNLRPGEFVLGWILTTAVVAMLVVSVANVPLGLLAVPVSAAMAHLVLGSRAGRRRARFADQLTTTLAIIGSSLRAGQSLPQAIELVGAEAPSPTAEQFQRIHLELRVGRDLTESMSEVARRMGSDDLEWLTQAIAIHRELGGDLTEILGNLAATIRERRTAARQISALSAEGRATGWLLLAMPVILFFFSWWRTPDSIDRMLVEPTGRLLLGAAITGMVIGHLWIRELVKLKF